MCNPTIDETIQHCIKDGCTINDMVSKGIVSSCHEYLAKVHQEEVLKLQGRIGYLELVSKTEPTKETLLKERKEFKDRIDKAKKKASEFEHRYALQWASSDNWEDFKEIRESLEGQEGTKKKGK